jgi:hypothetical protein
MTAHGHFPTDQRRLVGEGSEQRDLLIGRRVVRRHPTKHSLSRRSEAPAPWGLLCVTANLDADWTPHLKELLLRGVLEQYLVYAAFLAVKETEAFLRQLMLELDGIARQQHPGLTPQRQGLPRIIEVLPFQVRRGINIDLEPFDRLVMRNPAQGLLRIVAFRTKEPRVRHVKRKVT